MGYYLQGPTKGKAAHLIESHGAMPVSVGRACEAMTDPSIGVICIKDYGGFESAAFCYCASEFVELAKDQSRLTDWLLMDRAAAEELSGYAVRGRP